MSSLGLGSVVAALTLAARGRASAWAIVGGAVLAGCAEVAMAATTLMPVAMVLGFAVGFGMITMAAHANSTIQLAAPDALRGRVIGVYTTVFVGSTPVGGLATGIVASVLGVAAAIAIGGALAVLTAVGGAFWLRSIRARQRDVASLTPEARPGV
jgi:MFS family permease